MLDRQNLPHVLQICRTVEGSPLGLELAASRMNAYSPQVLAEELAKSVAILQRNSQRERGHRSVTAAFEASWGLLSEGKQDAYAKLAVFAGGFPANAVTPVTGVRLELIGRLVDCSLLRHEERYRFHPLLYACVSEKLRAHPAQKEVQAQHQQYYLAQLEEVTAAPSERKNSLPKLLSPELENIKRAWRCALQGEDYSHLQRLVYPLEHLFDTLARAEEVLGLLAYSEKAVAGADSRGLRAALRASQAWLSYRIGDYKQAIKLAEATLEQTSAAEVTQTRQTSLNTLGASWDTLGNFERARDYFRQNPELNAASLDGMLASIKNSLGIVELKLGNYPAARSYFEDALRFFQEEGNNSKEVVLRYNLSRLALAEGDIYEARCSLLRGQSLSYKHNLQYWLPLFYVQSTQVALRRKRLRQAERLSQKALRIAQETRNKVVEGLSLTARGSVAQAQGELHEARMWWQRAYQLTAELSDRPQALQILVKLAGLALEQQLSAARVALKELLKEAQAGSSMMASDRSDLLQLARRCKLEPPEAPYEQMPLDTIYRLLTPKGVIMARHAAMLLEPSALLRVGRLEVRSLLCTRLKSPGRSTWHSLR